MERLENGMEGPNHWNMKKRMENGTDRVKNRTECVENGTERVKNGVK